MERALLLLGLLAGCAAYEPPGLDRARPTYTVDLTECQENEPVALDAYNAKKALRWFAAPFTKPFRINDAIDACMTKKGYARAG